MDERIQLEKPKGLNEVKALIESLIDVKDRIESGEVEMPDVVKTEIENSIVDLVKERCSIEKRLNGISSKLQELSCLGGMYRNNFFCD
jgi:stress response protein YsnF